MSELLDSLTKIENVASNISSSADSVKNELSAKYKEMTLAFDSQLKMEVQKKLDAISTEYESDILNEQAKLHKQADDELIHLNNFYQNHRDSIIKKIISNILEVDNE